MSPLTTDNRDMNAVEDELRARIDAQKARISELTSLLYGIGEAAGLSEDGVQALDGALEGELAVLEALEQIREDLREDDDD